MDLLYEVEGIGLYGTDTVVVLHEQLAKAVGSLPWHAGLSMTGDGD